MLYQGPCWRWYMLFQTIYRLRAASEDLDVMLVLSAST